MNNVAVIGGAGFVGSYLSEMLVARGFHVAVIDNLSNGHTLVDGVEHINIDARDVISLARALNGYDTVFNLAAAVGGIYFNINNQTSQLSVNAALQIEAIHAAEIACVEKFLQVSSVCVYDPSYQKPGHGISEDVGLLGEPHPANSGYAWGKRIGEIAARNCDLPHTVTVRPSNIAGPRDYFDDKAHVIPAMIKKAVHEDQITVHGNLEFVREFIHVRDVAKGMLWALEHGENKQVYNLGSGNVVSIGALAEMIRDTISPEKEIVHIPSEGGDPWRMSDTSRVRGIGWSAKKSMNDIVEEAYQWYQSTFLL